jgi:hypothetical protein
MNSETALRLARDHFGRDAAILDCTSGRASTPGARLAARQARAELRGFAPLLDADRFQRSDGDLQARSTRYRFLILRISAGGAQILGRGDSWGEAFSDARSGFASRLEVA